MRRLLVLLLVLGAFAAGYCTVAVNNLPPSHVYKVIRGGGESVRVRADYYRHEGDCTVFYRGHIPLLSRRDTSFCVPMEGLIVTEME